MPGAGWSRTKPAARSWRRKRCRNSCWRCWRRAGLFRIWKSGLPRDARRPGGRSADGTAATCDAIALTPNEVQERKAGKMISRRAVLWGAPLVLGARPVWAQEAVPVTIGVLTDMSGMLHENATGHGAVEAARLAIEDSGGSVLGRPIRLLVADHQNKPDIGTAILAKWYRKTTRPPRSSSPHPLLPSRGFTSRPRNTRLRSRPVRPPRPFRVPVVRPSGFTWVYNTYSTSKATVTALMAEHADTWFFITADCAFRHSLEQAPLTGARAGRQGAWSGTPSVPDRDFSSYLLQAQASGAEVIALADGGQDLQNAGQQAA